MYGADTWALYVLYHRWCIVQALHVTLTSCNLVAVQVLRLNRQSFGRDLRLGHSSQDHFGSCSVGWVTVFDAGIWSWWRVARFVRRVKQCLHYQGRNATHVTIQPAQGFHERQVLYMPLRKVIRICQGIMESLWLLFPPLRELSQHRHELWHFKPPRRWHMCGHAI